jgi:hypothetical protein
MRSSRPRRRAALVLAGLLLLLGLALHPGRSLAAWRPAPVAAAHEHVSGVSLRHARSPTSGSPGLARTLARLPAASAFAPAVKAPRPLARPKSALGRFLSRIGRAGRLAVGALAASVIFSVTPDILIRTNDLVVPANAPRAVVVVSGDVSREMLNPQKVTTAIAGDAAYMRSREPAQHAEATAQQSNATRANAPESYETDSPDEVTTSERVGTFLAKGGMVPPLALKATLQGQRLQVLENPTRAEVVRAIADPSVAEVSLVGHGAEGHFRLPRGENLNAQHISNARAQAPQLDVFNQFSCGTKEGDFARLPSASGARQQHEFASTVSPLSPTVEAYRQLGQAITRSFAK